MTPALRLERSTWKSWRSRHQSAGSSKYETSATGSYRAKGRSVVEAEVFRRIARSDVLVFGDDRLVPQDQKTIVTLLQDWKVHRSRSVMVTDRISKKKKQRWIDRWMSGEVSPKKLFTVLGWEVRGEKYPEGGCSALVLSARKRFGRIVVCGEAGDLARQDRKLAAEVDRWARMGNKVAVWTGSLRLAPSKLPSILERENLSFLSLSLSAPECRWISGRTKGWWEIGRNQLYWLGRSPFLSLEFHRAWNVRSGPLIKPEQLLSIFHKSVVAICRKIGVHRPPKMPKVFHVFDTGFFEFLASTRLRKDVRVFLSRRVQRAESATLSRPSLVLISTLELGHLAEEAGHFVRCSTRKSIPTGPYSIAMEEAFGFLASRWLDPKRKTPPFSSEEKSPWGVLHYLGYDLGGKLADRWKRDSAVRRNLRRLWRVYPEDESEARNLWFALSELT